MVNARRVVGSEHVEDARQRGRLTLEIMPGDIVTDLAKETANRLNIALVDGPLERPKLPKTDGATATVRALTRRSPKWLAPKPRNISRHAGKLTKLALVGSGGVGTNIAHLAANAELAHEISIIDVVPGLAEATALDLNHCAGITRSKTRIVGSTDLSLVSDADVVVVTAGKARSPGMTRADLIETNKRVIQTTAEPIKTLAPNAVVIVVTNPLDEMTFEMLKATQFPRERVLGMAGTLDSSRFRRSLAKAAGVELADVEAIALGSHGDEMAPITSAARIKGRSLEAFLAPDVIDECVDDAVTGGGQVVALRKTGSATLAPAHASIELIDHIRGARTGSVPVSVMLDGEFGITDVVLGVPCYLGKSGMVSVDEMNLSPSESNALSIAAEAIRARLGTS